MKLSNNTITQEMMNMIDSTESTGIEDVYNTCMNIYEGLPMPAELRCQETWIKVSTLRIMQQGNQPSTIVARGGITHMGVLNYKKASPFLVRYDGDLTATAVVHASGQVANIPVRLFNKKELDIAFCMNAQKAELKQTGLHLNIAGLFADKVGPNYKACGTGKSSNHCIKEIMEELANKPPAEHPTVFDFDDKYLQQSEKQKQQKRKAEAQQRLSQQREANPKARKLTRADSAPGPAAVHVAGEAPVPVAGGAPGPAAGGAADEAEVVHPLEEAGGD